MDLDHPKETEADNVLTVGNDCDHCASQLRFQLLQRTYGKKVLTAGKLNELFHQPCSICPDSHPDDEKLCPFCKHLRLRHLVKCEIEKYNISFLPLSKSMMEKGEPAKCPLCRILRFILLKSCDDTDVFDTSKGVYDIVLGLAKCQPRTRFRLASLWKYSLVGKNMRCDFSERIRIGSVDQVALPCVGEKISWEHLRKEIDECSTQHPDCWREVDIALPQRFRVIDVRRRCLVETNECRFIALSYVWGRQSILRSSLLTATRAAVGDMMKEGGLPALDMPRTIEDAMLVCATLGETYLWVDRLCILQDDAEDKVAQIRAMGRIYSSAQLVLIAAYGDHMDFGVPGISRPRETIQSCENTLGLRIVNIIPEDIRGPLAVWGTRGWTYQEAALARRRLYFTKLTAFLECQHSMSHEDQYNTDSDVQSWASTALSLPEDRSCFESFLRHVEGYMSRSLTYRSDTYNAFVGIQDSLFGAESTFFYGMPQVDFDRAMCWIYDGDAKPGNIEPSTENQGIIIPTWSWASIMTLPGRELSNQRNEIYGMVAPWFMKDNSSSQGLLKALNVHEDTTVDEDWQHCMAIACSEGIVANVSFQLSPEDEDFLTVKNHSRSRWKNYMAFCREIIQLTPISISDDDNALMSMMREGVILTRTQTATFRLELGRRIDYHECNILDNEQDRVVGRLWGTSSLSIELQDRTALYEFIPLSLSAANDETLHGLSQPVVKSKEYLDMKGEALGKILVLNVLMIGWRGPYAYRRHFGQVFLKDWAQSHREWKTIMLE